MTQSDPLKSTQFQNRLKKIMQADEDVGKVAAGSTYLVACALEAFLDTLLTGSVNWATDRNARTLTGAHLKATIAASPLLDFCKDSVASHPDLPPVGSDNPVQARKRRRTTAAPEGGSGTKQAQGRKGRGKSRAALVEEVGGDAGEEQADDILPNRDIDMDASLLVAAPGQEAEDEDYDI